MILGNNETRASSPSGAMARSPKTSILSSGCGLQTAAPACCITPRLRVQETSAPETLSSSRARGHAASSHETASLTC
jgi:hypothetical protein